MTHTSTFDIGEVRTRHVNGSFVNYLASEGSTSAFRFATLLEKEPETIEWIDTFEPGETLWDIGANIGIYSIYAGLRGINVVAFEPHFANYYQLCANVILNNLQGRVKTYCLAIAERKAMSTINLANIDFGTSMSSFDSNLDFRGNPYVPAFQQGMMGYSLDALVADFNLEVPNHIKIDVDNIELDIVRGARKTLADKNVKSVSIELVDTDSFQVDSVAEILDAAGLIFIHKKQNPIYATHETRDVMNFLYRRLPHSEDETVVTAQSILDRLIRKIDSAPMDEQPSPNIYMEDLFLPEVYAEILSRLPRVEAYSPLNHPDARLADGTVTRLLLDLSEDSIATIQQEDQGFWTAMKDILTSKMLQDAIIRKFRNKLVEQFGGDLPEMVSVPIFYKDFPGYFIRVHEDAAFKVATFQLYLPADESQIHLGTSFHRQNGDKFELLKTNAFKPNSGYAFARTDTSWHSVQVMGERERVRNTLALTIYVKGKEYKSTPK